MADFSEGNWPASSYISPWLNKQMQDELKFHSNQIKLSSSLYYFYLLTHNAKVIITRSIKQTGNASLLTSSYMLKLKHLCPHAIIVQPFSETFYKSDMLSENKAQKPIIDENLVYSPFFVSKLSVTDVEMLLRNPYSFYVKKILGLRKFENISSAPKLSEFGSFIHNVIESYTNEYKFLSNDKIKNIQEISDKLLSQTLLPLHTKEMWKIKFASIAEEFVKFDEERRFDVNTVIYSEIKGEMNIKLSNQTITITAIADRIEIDQNGVATILDYKTGALPVKKDVLSGFSPQLVLEALILLEDGFNIKVNEVEKLIYVKIASSKPYIQTLEISLDRAQLTKHLEGVKALLEHYTSTKAFPKEIDFLKYNDYVHLARNIHY
jgi:ATP-dependent helicase/nuclease subunit B